MKSINQIDQMWTKNPQLAFSAFVKSTDFVKLGRRLPTVDRHTPDDNPNEIIPIRDSVAKVYMAMFNKFLRWLSKNGYSFVQVEPIHIITFIEGDHSEDKVKPVYLKSAIKTRYIRMLERTYQHIGLNPNPAKIASLDARNRPDSRGKDEPSDMLDPQKVEAFLKNLPNPENWKRARDRAMLSMLIGAGLKTSELLSLRVENIGKIQQNGFVPVTISAASVEGTSRWHQTQLRPFAVQNLMSWLEIRESMSFMSDILFPANLSGAKLNEATLYRAVKKVFKASHIDVKRFGGRTLRNTFAVTELKSGTAHHRVKEYLGLNEDKSLNIYLELANMEMYED